jgi:hypothetical protein
VPPLVIIESDVLFTVMEVTNLASVPQAAKLISNSDSIGN